MNNAIKFSINNDIAIITLSKHPLNILNINDLNYLTELLNKFSQQENLKAIIIKSDQKIFSAGLNISEHNSSNIQQLLNSFNQLFIALFHIDIPTISIINNGCYGGGLELAIFCDFVFATNNAEFAFPEIELGCYPPLAMAFLSDIIGKKKALELILTGEKIDSKQALNFGLINNCFEENVLEQKVNQFIKDLTSKSLSVLKLTNKTFKKLHYPNFINKLTESTNIYINDLMILEDSNEGIKSFIEKRQPLWKHK